jgi:rSAM/selenodomain-associated transferase 2
MTKISIIIPVLNEINSIGNTLKVILPISDIEIIIVDGGSRDETVKFCENLGLKVISSVKGRSLQMNTGAKFATADILLFLHGDTLLPVNFVPLIQQTLMDNHIIAGAFELKINSPKWGLRWIEKLVKWRSRIFQLPYGDQAIFLRKSTFIEIGGFPEIPIMEDFELIRMLRKKGQIKIVPESVITSARRWEKLGIFKTTLINQIVILGYFLGIKPEKIALWYRGHKKS